MKQTDDDNEDLTTAYDADMAPVGSNFKYTTPWEDAGSGFGSSPEVQQDRKAQTTAALRALSQMAGHPEVPPFPVSVDQDNGIGDNTLGRTNFDNKTIKYNNSLEGSKLRNTLVHEFLHSLGEGHQLSNPADIMTPYAETSDRNRKFEESIGQPASSVDDQQLAFTVAHAHDPLTRRHLWDFQHQDPTGSTMSGEQSAKYKRSPDLHPWLPTLRNFLGIDPDRDLDAEPFDDSERTSLMNYVYGDKKKQ